MGEPDIVFSSPLSTVAGGVGAVLPSVAPLPPGAAPPPPGGGHEGGGLLTGADDELDELEDELDELEDELPPDAPDPSTVTAISGVSSLSAPLES